MTTETETNTEQARSSAAHCSPFDLEAVYDAEIAPLMTQIIAICQRHNMPMLASFMYQHHHGEDERESYCTTSLGGEGNWKPEKIIKATEIIRRNDSFFAAFTVTRRDTENDQAHSTAAESDGGAQKGKSK